MHKHLVNGRLLTGKLAFFFFFFETLISSIRLLVFSSLETLWDTLSWGILPASGIASFLGARILSTRKWSVWKDGWCCISQPEPHRHKEREHRQGKRKKEWCGVGLVCTEEERWTFLGMFVGLNCLVYGRERSLPNTSFSPFLPPFAGSIQRRTGFCGT